MKKTFLTEFAISKTERRANVTFGKRYKRQKFSALSALYDEISAAVTALIMFCAGYFLSPNLPEFNRYGALLIAAACVLIPAAIRALDRINNPAKETGN